MAAPTSRETHCQCATVHCTTCVLLICCPVQCCVVQLKYMWSIVSIWWRLEYTTYIYHLIHSLGQLWGTHLRGKFLGPRGMYFLVHPSSWQCTDTLHLLPVSSALHFTGYLHITNFVLNWSNLAQCTEEMGALLWLLEDSALWASPRITE